MSKIHSVAIGALFYVGWFGSVFLANSKYDTLSLSFPILLVGFLYFKNYLNLNNILLAFSISALGILFDSMAIKMNWIKVPEADFFIIPIWLVAIWLLFSFSMVRLGLILNPPMWLATILGFVMGPLSYKSGQILGVLFLAIPYGFIIYGIFWALMFPAVLRAAKRLS